MPSPASDASCSTRPAARTLSLPVLKTPSGGGGRNAWAGQHPTIGHSKMGRWRAAALVLVHVLIGIHIVQWLITGMTVSPVEPSESMHTLRTGVVNAGFVFFALAILSTLILGRFFCGWACHVVALQDLCAWMMAKVRVKPTPFRSRLLIYIPLGLALYMFVWPVFHREILQPLVADAQGRMPAWLGQSEPINNIQAGFLVEDFWATFPTWYVAIPFLFIIGFACVYFLGAKGFCTYGCPYGGFFGPADLVAPGKIRVHDDKCHQCGHCTAVCTSNVRVHEEVRDFGMVVDPGCMKCLDCVSVCPNDALYFGMGAPTVLAKPKKGREESAARAKAMREARYDLSRREELVVGLLFLALFFCYRGMLYQVPMLMAVGIAGIVCVLCVKSWRMLTLPNVRLQSLQLKFKGSVRPWGWAVLASTALLLVAGAWSGTVRYHFWQAEMAYAKLQTPVAYVLRPDFAPTPGERAAAESSLRHYTIAGPPGPGGGAGGIGWNLRADDLINVAYMQTLLGRYRDAEATMRRVLDEGRPLDALVTQFGMVMQARGAKTDEVLDMYRGAVEKHPTLMGIRGVLAGDLLAKGRRDEAVKVIDEGLAAAPRSADARIQAAPVLARAGQVDRARTLIDEAIARDENNPELLLRAAQAWAALGERDKAVSVAEQAAQVARRDSARRIGAAGLLAQLGQSERALMEALRGVERVREKGRWIGRSGVLFSAGLTKHAAGKPEDGLALIREAIELARSGSAAWDLVSMGNTLAQAGMGGPGRRPDAALLTQAIVALSAARDAEPASASIRYDLAVAYYAAGLKDKAVPEMKAAAETNAASAFLAERFAQLLAEQGRSDEAKKWFDEAAKRKAGAPKP
jgi:polyferredoxin/tetratricopeptide (TPR) repeat protein